jgi:hypothetical protein
LLEGHSEGPSRRGRHTADVVQRAEVIRLSVDRVLEMEKFWRFMDKTRATLSPGSVDE